MNPDIAKKWAEALRSGEYQQGRGCLHPASGKFCCLGVLCDLFRKETGVGVWQRTEDGCSKLFDLADADENRHGVLPRTVREWAGMRSDSGVIPRASAPPEHCVKLAVLNDEGASFSQIADIIEEHAGEL